MSILEPCIENVPDSSRNNPQDVTEDIPDEQRNDHGIEDVQDEPRNNTQHGTEDISDEPKNNTQHGIEDVTDQSRNDQSQEGTGDEPINDLQNGTKDIPDDQRNSTKDGTEDDLQDVPDQRKKYPKECYPGRRRHSAGYHSHSSTSDSNTSDRTGSVTSSNSSSTSFRTYVYNPYPPRNSCFPAGVYPWPVSEWPVQDWQVTESSSNPPCASDSSTYRSSFNSKTSSEGVYEDPEFRNLQKSLNSRQSDDMEWIRIPEFSSRVNQVPMFAPSVDDKQEVYQRRLPNCWLVPGMSKLTKYPKLFQLVVPPNQTFTENYDGSFKFNLWNFGNWVEVVVDDRIPVVDHDEHFGVLSSVSGVFWPPLLEKAFAKILQSYDETFWPSEAMTALTGGLCEVHLFDKVFDKKLVTDHLAKAVQENAMISAGTPENPKLFWFGLCKTHNYSVVKVFKTIIKSGPMKGQHDFIVLKNPHDPTPPIQMYRGPWSPTSLEWNSLTDDARSELETHLGPGEFFITLDNLYEVIITVFVTLFIGFELQFFPFRILMLYSFVIWIKNSLIHVHPEA